jgi:hypothetical protein
MIPTSRTLLVLATLAVPSTAFAQDRDRCESRTELPPTVNLRVDNDLFGGGQDQGYSSGVQLRLVSPNLLDYTDDPCLPRLARWLNRYLDVLQPEGFEQQNMVVTFGQAIYTPTDFTRSDLIVDDRPYAATLLVGFGYNARQGDSLRHTQLQLGIVGPSALGEQIQDAVHDLTSDYTFAGWDNQLSDEPVFALVHERMRRFAAEEHGLWGWDAVAHWGGSLGNLATYANAGGELRFGRNLPDDFGSTPLRPAGENTAPTTSRRTGGVFGIHAFLTVDGRWVLRDITLDGNTWKDSHSVDKRAFVGDAGLGLALLKGRWKFALARYYRTREFEGQDETPTFGSFTISRSF